MSSTKESAEFTQAPDSVDSVAAESYVDSVMATHKITKVDTPKLQSKKRHLSAPGSKEGSPKKLRNERRAAKDGLSGGNESGGEYDGDNAVSCDVGETGDSGAARRKLYRKGSQLRGGNLVITQADVHDDSEVSIKQMLAKMAADMNMHYNSLHERIDKFEAGLEQRISNKVAQLLDKRVNSEMGRIRKDVDERLDAFKETFRSEIDEEFDLLSGKLDSLQNIDHSHDRSLNIATRGLPESNNEHLNDKVNNVIRTGLKIRNITVRKAERKVSRSPSKPGVVIASFRSAEDKRNVMAEKSKLKDNTQFQDVFIQHDESREQRVMASNFRTMLQAMNNNDTNVSVRGHRVICMPRNSNQQSESNRNTRQRNTESDRSFSNGTAVNTSSQRGNNDGNRRGDWRGHGRSGRRGGQGSARGRNQY